MLRSGKSTGIDAGMPGRVQSERLKPTEHICTTLLKLNSLPSLNEADMTTAMKQIGFYNAVPPCLHHTVGRMARSAAPPTVGRRWYCFFTMLVENVYLCIRFLTLLHPLVVQQ